VQELRALRPREVLEIGCGHRAAATAPGWRVRAICRRGCLSRGSEQTQKANGGDGGDWSNVTLLERAADNLERVLRRILRHRDLELRGEVLSKRILFERCTGRSTSVGQARRPHFHRDVRNLALIEPYAVSIEVYQAQPATSLNDLRERVRRRILSEDQLLLFLPAFFLALRARFRRITGVEVHPRRGPLRQRNDPFSVQRNP